MPSRSDAEPRADAELRAGEFDADAFEADAFDADPRAPEPPPLGPDRRLWFGLAAGMALLALLIALVHELVPAAPPARVTGNGSLNRDVPLMTRPQLLENQQAMPELIDFDSQTQPSNPNNGGALSGTLGSPTLSDTGVPGP
jgi:hypothetical protein